MSTVPHRLGFDGQPSYCGGRSERTAVTETKGWMSSILILVEMKDGLENMKSMPG